MWQSLIMGNRDARSREKKKPKKQTPKIAPAPRIVHQTTTPPAIKKPIENQ
jgi:hypothetical protein